jgi:hypothetical protein
MRRLFGSLRSCAVSYYEREPQKVRECQAPFNGGSALLMALICAFPKQASKASWCKSSCSLREELGSCIHPFNSHACNTAPAALPTRQKAPFVVHDEHMVFLLHQKLCWSARSSRSACLSMSSVGNGCEDGKGVSQGSLPIYVKHDTRQSKLLVITCIFIPTKSQIQQAYKPGESHIRTRQLKECGECGRAQRFLAGSALKQQS